MSTVPDESNGKGGQGGKSVLSMSKKELTDACKARGINTGKGPDNKSPTMYILKARFFLAQAGAQPNTAMDDELGAILRDDKKDQLLASLRKLDPATGMTDSASRSELALALARFIANRDKREHTKRPAHPSPTDSIIKAIANVKRNKRNQADHRHGATSSSPGSSPEINPLGIQDPTSNPTGGNGPRIFNFGGENAYAAPNPSDAAQGDANNNSNNSNNIGFGTNGFGTNGFGTNGFGTNGFGTNGLRTNGLRTNGLGANDFQNDNTSGPGPRSHAFGGEADYVAIGGQQEGLEQAALVLGHGVLHTIDQNDAVKRLFSQLLTAHIQNQATERLNAAEQELEVLRRQNDELREAIARVEVERNETRDRNDELLEEKRQRAERSRTTLATLQRLAEEWRAAHRAQATTQAELGRLINDFRPEQV